MNVENLNKLIAHMKAQPADAIHMFWATLGFHGRSVECGCIMAHSSKVLGDMRLHVTLGVDIKEGEMLACPDGWRRENDCVRRYPAHRVIATLKRLRDTYLSTGQVVVDWGPEPGEEPKTPWVAPHVSEVIAPTLPAEITSLLRPSLAKTEA